MRCCWSWPILSLLLSKPRQCYYWCYASHGTVRFSSCRILWIANFCPSPCEIKCQCIPRDLVSRSMLRAGIWTLCLGGATHGTSAPKASWAPGGEAYWYLSTSAAGESNRTVLLFTFHSMVASMNAWLLRYMNTFWVQPEAIAWVLRQWCGQFFETHNCFLLWARFEHLIFTNWQFFTAAMRQSTLLNTLVKVFEDHVERWWECRGFLCLLCPWPLCMEIELAHSTWTFSKRIVWLRGLASNAYNILTQILLYSFWNFSLPLALCLHGQDVKLGESVQDSCWLSVVFCHNGCYQMKVFGLLGLSLCHDAESWWRWSGPVHFCYGVPAWHLFMQVSCFPIMIYNVEQVSATILYIREPKVHCTMLQNKCIAHVCRQAILQDRKSVV